MQKECKPRRRTVKPVSAVIALKVAGDWIEPDTLRVQLAAAAADGTQVQLDFEGLDRLDARVFQVLLAAGRTAWAQSGKLLFTHLEGGVEAGIAQAGARELLPFYGKVATQ